MAFNPTLFLAPFLDFMGSDRVTSRSPNAPFSEGFLYNNTDFDFDDWNPWGNYRQWASHDHHHHHHRRNNRHQQPSPNPPAQARDPMVDSPDTMSARAPTPETTPADTPVPDPAESIPEDTNNINDHRPCGSATSASSHYFCPFRRGGHHSADLDTILRNVVTHPLIQTILREAQTTSQESSVTSHDGQPTSSDGLAPAVDVFNTPSAYILHIVLPGAKKEDIGITWDPETSSLTVAGVMHRPGDEEFLSNLISGERRVGLFERKIALPPAGVNREDIDCLAISAKLEDGLLIVTVPKREKEWTEIHKIDIDDGTGSDTNVVPVKE